MKWNDGDESVERLQFQGPGIVHAGSLSLCQGLLGRFNRTEPSIKNELIPSSCLSGEYVAGDVYVRSAYRRSLLLILCNDSPNKDLLKLKRAV